MASRDQQYISNYATLYVKDVLARIDGVGDVNMFGARDYSMRIWLDPASMLRPQPDRGRRRQRAAGRQPPGRRRRRSISRPLPRPAHSRLRCRRWAA